MRIETDGQTLRLAGDLDVRSTEQVRSAIYDLLGLHREVVVDLSEVSSVDVTALKLLAAATRYAHGLDRELRLRGCNGAVRRLLALTRLRRLVTVERAPALA